MNASTITRSEQDLETASEIFGLLDKAAQLTSKGTFSQEDSKRCELILRHAEILEQLRDGKSALRNTMLAAKERRYHLDDQAWTSAFQRWTRYGFAKLEPTEKEILDRHRQRFSEEDAPSEVRALGVVTGAGGGYLASQSQMQELQEVLKGYSAIRRSAAVITTAKGTDLPTPTTDETAVEGEMLTENTTATEQDITFGQVVLKSFRFSSKIVRVSKEWLEDAMNAPQVVNRLLAARIGRAQNKKFTIGNGTTEPQGALVAASAGKVGTTGQTTTIIFDDLIDLVHSVDAEYRLNASFHMNDATLKFVRKIKDTASQPVLQPAREPGGGDLLLGYRVHINPDVPIMSASAKSILFGDFGQFQVRDVEDLVLLRLPERYAEFGQIGFLGFLRSDSRLLSSGAIRYYQNPAA